MSAKIIKNDVEHADTLARIEQIFGARPGTTAGDELELLVHLVEAYEAVRYPIEPPDPVDAIKFRMEQDGLKQVDLVSYIGSKSKVSEVLSGKRPLSLAMIRALHEGLGIPAKVLIRESGKTLSAVYEGLNWNDFPIAEMVKRQWFPGFKGSVHDLLEQAEERVGPLLFPDGEDCRTKAMAARQRVRNGSVHDEQALWAWQARVRQLSQTMKLGTYDPKGMTLEFIRTIIGLSRLADGPIQAGRVLSESGIGMVVLHYLPGTHLDGAAMLRSDGRPIVSLTLRHDRLDNFWFTLAHELAHVVLHLAKGDESAFMDDLENPSDSDGKECQADALAKECLIPATDWAQAKLQIATDAKIRELAVRTHLHPAIVAGRLRFEKKDYTIFNHLVGQGMVRKLFPAYKAGEIA